MYEYANRLCKLGYSVHITYPIQTKYMKYRFPYWIRSLLSKIEGFRTNKWFEFDSKITMSYVNSIDEKYIVDADIIIVTWWSTVSEVALLSNKKGRIINLIQGYEDWEGHVDELHASYDLKNTYNVVVANYLQKIVSTYTKKNVICIPNAIDNNVFKIKKSIEQRNPLNICMLYSIQEIKGSKYGLEALYKLYNKYPDIKVDLFGICPQPTDLPHWITYHYNSSNLPSIYNNNAIFISNSLTEGFGLVSVEAMACGCALVCTDIEGHTEYAIHKKTALLVQPKKSDDVVDKVSFLIENKIAMQELAINGNDFIKQYSWDVSTSKMNYLIQNILHKEKI